jgi:hypothetical protein
VENWLWKRLCTCRKADYGLNEIATYIEMGYRYTVEHYFMWQLESSFTYTRTVSRDGRKSIADAFAICR